MLGLALGDALGAPFEFVRASEIPSPLPAFERTWVGLPPGTTTDDTAMARNLARSLAACGRLNLDDVIARHLSWYRSRPPDIGNLTRKVLQRASEGLSAPEAAEAIWRLRGPEVSAGNGSVMYCAPLGAAYANRRQALFDLAPKLSALTHHDQRCRTAVLAVTLAVAALVRGLAAEEAAASALAAVQDRAGGEELEFLVEAIGVTRPIDGPDQGFCLYAAAVGLQSLLRAGGTVGTGAERFERELRRVVALGGDADTNGAVAGALLGSLVGSSGLPPAWLGRLVEGEDIEREARALIPLASVRLDDWG
jgi:ADP-ribosyl-[dinitrogen reductase] hydrolase